MSLFALCPSCVRRYGFCGLLAVLYATRQRIPRTERAVEKILEVARRVLHLKKSKWTHSQPQNRGGVNIDHILTLLRASHCRYKVVRHKKTLLRQWLCNHVSQKHRCYSEYIIYITGHVVFVRIFPVIGKWLLYDQSGVVSHSSHSVWKRKHGALKTIRHLIKIL